MFYLLAPRDRHLYYPPQDIFPTLDNDIDMFLSTTSRATVPSAKHLASLELCLQTSSCPPVTLASSYVLACNVMVKSKAAGLPKPKNNLPAAGMQQLHLFDDDDMDGETENTKPVESARCTGSYSGTSPEP